MNARLERAPLRSKLRWIVLMTSAVSLVVAGAVLFTVHLYFFRTNFAREVALLAQVTARSCASAVAEGSRGEAMRIMREHLAESRIVSARIVLRDGTEFARYRYSDHDFAGRANSDRAVSWWEGGNLLRSLPLGAGGKNTGTFFLVADYQSEARGLISLYLGIHCAVIAATLLAGLVISNHFVHLIADPLKRLADTVRRIAGSGDYSVRAERVSDDEVGAFTDSFNEMLGEIQTRDTALRHEIAERERAERELQTVHAQLLDASRQAGMAEVATGVLHNVGNVLNSVNVSATIITERLNAGRLDNLARTAEMLVEKGAALPQFLASDAKGRLIPNYLADLAKHLAGQRQGALVELDLLRTNIEHIKEIVSMQQNYARITGLAEPLPPDLLVEDALRMTVSNPQRKGIEVVREYESKDLIFAERHRVLQILVNLIRNAKHALTEGAPQHKRLSVRTHRLGDDMVALTVADNGMGIPPENLTRIFGHGFTTRKDGHGFGLHSAALAAKEMGGRLVAESDGPSRGAKFTLELPMARMEVAA
jgi:signal transduction histidine kinase